MDMLKLVVQIVAEASISVQCWLSMKCRGVRLDFRSQILKVG